MLNRCTLCKSIVSKIFRFYTLNRRSFQTSPSVRTLNRKNEVSLKCPCSFRLCSTRNVHMKKIYYSTNKRDWVVTHMAEQEVALAALRRLEFAVNKFKRAKKSDIELVLQGSLKDIFVKDNDVIFLIRCCGSLLANENVNTRRAMAKAVWDKICKSSVHLENEHFVALLKTNCENQQPLCPKEFLSEMKQLGVQPNGETLLVLLLCMKVVENLEENMTFVIEEIKSRKLDTEPEYFVTLASVLANNGKISEADDVVHSLRKKGLEIPSSVYVSLIKGHIVVGEKELVLKILDQMKERGVKLSSEEYALVVTKLAEISSMPSNRSWKLMESVMPHIDVPVFKETFLSVSNALVELLHSGKEDAACLLVLSLPPSLHFGSSLMDPLVILLLKEIARAGIAKKKILDICDRLEGFSVRILKWEGCLRPFALHTVTGYALQHGDSELMVFLLEALSQQGAPLRPHYFWPLLLITGKEEDVGKRQKGVLKVLKKMLTLTVAVDFETLAHYILPFVKPNSSALDMLTVLQKSGVSGAVCRTAVTCRLLEKGDVIEAANFNEVHRGKINPVPLVEPLAKCMASSMAKLDSPLLLNLVKLLKSMREKGMKSIDYTGHFLLQLTEKLGLFESSCLNESHNQVISYLLEVLKALDSEDLRISAQASDYLFDALHPQLDVYEAGLAKSLHMPPVDHELFLPSSEFQHIIPHPRDMDVGDLESHLLELKAKGLNDRGVMRRLLQLHCRKRNVKRAMELKRDIELAGHSFSAGMMSSLLELYIQDDALDKAEEMYLQIKCDHPKFNVDDHKIIDLSALMCKRGKVKEGVALLMEHAKMTQPRPGPGIERNLLNLLKIVHSGGSEPSRVHQDRQETTTGTGLMEEVKVGNAIWTSKTLFNELIKLGFIANPPPKSTVSKFEELTKK